MTLDQLTGLLKLTFAAPRAAARQLMALNLPLSAGWTAVLLMAVVSSAVGFLGLNLSQAAMEPGLAAIFGSPLRTAVVQFAAIALTGLLAFWVGQRLGGRGSLAQALTLVAWAQVPPIILQLFQLVAILSSPAFAPVLGILGFGVYAVILTLFLTELHGFRSPLLVFFAMIGVSFLVAILAAFLVAILIGVPHV